MSLAWRNIVPLYFCHNEKYIITSLVYNSLSAFEFWEKYMTSLTHCIVYIIILLIYRTGFPTTRTLVIFVYLFSLLNFLFYFFQFLFPVWFAEFLYLFIFLRSTCYAYIHRCISWNYNTSYAGKITTRVSFYVLC